MLRLATSLFIAFLWFSTMPESYGSTLDSSAAKHTVHSPSSHSHGTRNGKRLFLVPPPPPYVPSLLPELTYSRYYGHPHASNSPKLFKPNKYLTYCL